MSKYDSSQVGFFLLGGYSLLGAVSKIEDVVELKLSETPVLGQADEDYYTSGAKKTTITQDGWFDDATNSVHEAFKDVSDVPLPLVLAAHGNVAGYAFDGYPSVQRVGYTVQMTVSEAHKANGSYGCYYGKRGGTIVANLATRSTAANTDAADITCSDTQPAGTNGGYMFVNVTELTGSPTSVTITLRHSTDGVTYADKQATDAIPLADVPSASGYAVALTGQINKWVSAAWSYSGGTAPTVTFFLGVYVAP